MVSLDGDFDLADVNRDDLILEVKDLLEALRPDQADLLVSYLMEGMTQQELANLLGVSRATVGRLIESAIAAARRAGGVAVLV